MFCNVCSEASHIVHTLRVDVTHCCMPAQVDTWLLTNSLISLIFSHSHTLTLMCSHTHTHAHAHARAHTHTHTRTHNLFTLVILLSRVTLFKEQGSNLVYNAEPRTNKIMHIIVDVIIISKLLKWLYLKFYWCFVNTCYVLSSALNFVKHKMICELCMMNLSRNWSCLGCRPSQLKDNIIISSYVLLNPRHLSDYHTLFIVFVQRFYHVVIVRWLIVCGALLTGPQITLPVYCWLYWSHRSVACMLIAVIPMQVCTGCCKQFLPPLVSSSACQIHCELFYKLCIFLQ